MDVFSLMYISDKKSIKYLIQKTSLFILEGICSIILEPLLPHLSSPVPLTDIQR